MRTLFSLFLTCSLCLLLTNLLANPAISAQTTQPAQSPLPRVVLIGDSIRLGYGPLVTKLLANKVEVLNSNWAGDSKSLLAQLEELVLKPAPTLIHFNVGLHDLRLLRKTKTYQIPLAEYEKNLEAITVKLLASKATVLFATTTPIEDAKHATRGGGFDRFDKDVDAYNEAALRIMRRHHVRVHDLGGLIRTHGVHGGLDKLLVNDGTHYTSAGKELQARAVADCVLRHLAVRQAKPAKLAVPEPKAPKATALYRQEEAKRDALVPEIYKKLPFGEFSPPSSAADWQKQRPQVLRKVVDSLGELPERPRALATLVAREIHPAFHLESLTLKNGLGEQMTMLLLVPAGLQKLQGAQAQKKSAPAILWLHSSSYDRHQLLMSGYNGGEEPFGETLARAGYVVLAPDAAWYGGRAGTGPSGSAETTRAQQESLHKLHLWFGRTLWGMFVHDDQCALDYLVTRPEVDRKRIGATGMSMGSTRAWWLAAVDERIACTVGVACLTRYRNLIEHGQLRQHGVYYFSNGLLRHFDSEGVVALIAPRPFLALNGELDAGSPADGIRTIEERVGRVYQSMQARDRFRSVLYPHTGHVHTPEMRRETLAWFARWLR